MPLRLVALQFSQPNQRPLDPDKGTRASKDETIQKRKTERGGSVVHFSGPNNSRPDCSQKQLQLLPHYHPYYYSTRAWRGVGGGRSEFAPPRSAREMSRLSSAANRKTGSFETERKCSATPLVLGELVITGNGTLLPSCPRLSEVP